MYCKYCGSRIASDTTKCVSCGANIDLNDGGQSFFDDNELDEWQSDSVSYNAQTSVPRTEMREPLPPLASNFGKEYNKVFLRPQASADTIASRSRARSKTKKNIFACFNLSSSNKLIILCIASALAIVLLVVAIIAVLNSRKNDVDESAMQSGTSGYTQQADSMATEQNSQQKTVVDSPIAENGAEQKNQENNAVKKMMEINDIKILDKDKNEIDYSVSAFIDEKYILYVSLDKILKHEGYKDGRPNRNDSNRIIYEHKTSGKVIEIEKQTNKIWITEPGKAPETKYLAENNFSIKDDTFVPIRSFLGELGYDKNKVKWESEDHILYFRE